MNKNSIWWRLTPVAYWLAITGALGLLAWQVFNSRWHTTPLKLLVWIPLMIAFWFPNLYLTAFSLWHWKYRFRGSHPVAWAVAFPFFWGYLPALFYYERHINPDRKNKRQYSTVESPETTTMPGYYNTLQSVCFVVGGFMITAATIAVVIMTVAFWVIFGTMNDILPNHVGKVLTSGDVNALRSGFRLSQVCYAILCGTTLFGVIGGILFSVSHSLRWRIKEKEERESSGKASETSS